MSWLFLSFLSSLLMAGFLLPLLQPGTTVILVILLTVLFISGILLFIKKKKITTTRALLLIFFVITGLITASRITKPLSPAKKPQSLSTGYFTNISVSINNFPRAIPSRDPGQGISYRTRISPELSIVSPGLAAMHPGQKVSLWGRYYHHVFQGRHFATLYVSSPPLSTPLTPPLPRELQTQLADLAYNMTGGITLTEDIYPWLSLISRIRVQAGNSIARHPDPELRALLFSIILGNRHWMDYSTRESFRRGGISHILALSGLHIGILSLCLIFLFSLFLSRKWVYGLTTLLIIFFVIFTGMSPSILRAGFLFASYTSLKTLGYDPDWVDLLSFTAFATLLINPSFLIDIGFLLSYSATLGIVLFSPQIRGLMEKAGLPSLIASPLSLSLCATLATLPLIISFFGGFSVVSLITNLLLVPLFFLLIPGLFLLFLTSIAGINIGLLDSLLSGLWKVIHFSSDILTRPYWVYQDTPPLHPTWTIAFYSVFLILIYTLPRLRFQKNINSANIE